ncbi:Eukaryotic initiation factor 4A-I [Linnemannia schmuckeri]|uniref:ATP-dependent RNA helicase n=1 Tax=Linnemannia schmuckeri TaxID=64567 RepID=A0A9P5S5X8_9FUNG|nr:Eukaryotic initiation factor 4A-I [Linnemannia schmuckeri]
MTQAAPTLAELSISLTHVQSLLRQITAEVKVLSDGITVLAEQEENDLEEELDYLDVDPWSKAKDKDEADATVTGATGASGGGAADAHRQDSIRSLLQRKPSTVKDETKALARILSQKRTPANEQAVSTNGEGNSDPEQQQQQHLSAAKWVALGLQDQVIDEDSVSSDGSTSGGGRRSSDKQELDLAADHDQSQRRQQLSSSVGSVTSSTTTTPQSPEAERVPHTITVQTTQMPTKFSLAITKPSTPQSPSVPVLSTSSSQSSILSAMNMNNHSNNNTMKGQLPFWRSSTTPNVTDSSRPNSAGSNFNSDGYSTRGGAHKATHRRSLQPDSRSNSDSQTLHHSSVADRYTQALRTATQGMVIHPPVGRDTVKSTITVRSSVIPMAAAQVEKVESADCFSKLGLIPELLRGIYAYGLKMPSILQQRGIPMIMTRHDVLTQAKPEVAKTLTYAIPLLNFLTLPATSIHPQLLILCSNHDLCLHVQRVLLALARFMPTISCLILAEGSNATLSLGTISTTQVNVAAYGGGGGRNGHTSSGYGSRGGSNADPLPVIAAHVVIGTPGKVLGLVRTKQISIAALKIMVLENADILLASPLKEATVSLLSMVRDPIANNSAGSVPGTSSGTAAGSTSTPKISPPNSGPTSPVSMAVAALNGRIMGTINGSTSNGSIGRFPGSYGEPEARPRSNSNAVSSTPSPQSPLNLMGTTKTPGVNQPQLLFFSTEVPAHVLDYVAQYMTQPTKALVKGHELALKGTLQFFKYLTVEDEEWRLELLCELLEDSGANRAVVFCNRDDSVSQVVRKIRERKGTAIGLYSDMDLSTRKAAVGRFRSSPPQSIFVLTDEVARALEPDILAVPLVVSYEMPSIGNYVPRVKWIDRSNGKVGVKVVLVDGQRGEGQALRAIQSHYRTSIEDMPVSIAEFIVN